MVDIYLDTKTDNYGGSNELITASTSNCDPLDIFHKVTYQIIYKQSYESAPWTFWWNRGMFSLYIKPHRGSKPIYTYNCYDETHLVSSVEVYYCDLFPTLPLIIGFVRKDKTNYYTTKHLIKTQSYTGFPSHPFSNVELNDRLNQEREGRTKLKFTVGGKSANYEKQDQMEYGYKKIKYTVSNNTNNNGPYLFTTDQLSEHGRLSEIISGLDAVKDQTFDYINIYYSANNVPLLLEFVSHTTLTESKKTYFKRDSKDGSKWKNIDKSTGNLGEGEKQTILKEVNHYVGKLIAVFLNKNKSTSGYYLKLFEASDKYSSYSQQKETITVNEETNAISNFKFKCYHQNFSKSNDTSLKSFITGFKLLFESQSNSSNSVDRDSEIKLFDKSGATEQTMYYTPGPGEPDNKSDIYFYFNHNDNLPLLLCYTGKWYRPNSKTEYFKKWVEVPELLNVRPKKPHSTNLDENKIVTSLEKTNKDLNEVFIEKTEQYGLDSDRKNPTNLNKIRISVNKEEVKGFFRKVTHKSVTGTSISKIFYETHELIDEKNKKLSETISSQEHSKNYNTITLYYHILDSNYKIPLILGISASIGASNKLLYERIGKVENKKWKTIQYSEVQMLQTEPQLTHKINDIHYKFNKSIMVQLEEQNSTGYYVKLIDNHVSASPSGSEQRDIGKILVSSDSSCFSRSKYKCYKHKIPALNGTVKPLDVGGLRLYIKNQEILTFAGGSAQKGQINYLDGKKDLHVYFYDNDKTPLLFRYDSLYYKPNGKSEYFNKWFHLSGITDPSAQLQTHLDGVNKSLNEVNISHTSDNFNYGLNVPSGNELPSLDRKFHERVSTKRHTSDHYNKVAHSTLNKMGICGVFYKDRQIISIQDQTANQVCVYYHPIDGHLAKPLLISLGSESPPVSSKWYSRDNMVGSSWQNELKISKYNSDPNIKKQLDAIYLKLFTSLTIQIETHEHYTPSIVGCENTNITLGGTIKVDPYSVSNYLKVTNYRRYEHQLPDYYETNIKSNLTLELSFCISGKKIGLFNKNGTVVPLIKYGPEELLVKSNLFVYFYDHPSSRTADDTDNVPLMINFQGKFYVPISKETYFDKWEDAEINLMVGSGGDSEITNSIKTNLERVNSMLNEVDPLKTSHYGVPCWNKHNYHKNGKFTSKRIKVSKHTAGSYIFYTHTPINKYKITLIKSINDRHFNQHSTHLTRREIDEVIMIFKTGYPHYPKLILLNQRDRSYSTTTYGYYYSHSERSGTPVNYQYKDLPRGSQLIDELNKEEENPFINFSDDDVQPIKTLWSELISNKMKPQDVPSDTEKEPCKDQTNDKLDLLQCPGANIVEQVDHVERSPVKRKGDSTPAGPQGPLGLSVDSHDGSQVVRVTASDPLGAQHNSLEHPGPGPRPEPNPRSESSLSPDLTHHSPGLSLPGPQVREEDGQVPPESDHLGDNSHRLGDRADHNLRDRPSQGKTVQELELPVPDPDSLKNLDEHDLEDSASTTYDEYSCFGFGDVIKEAVELPVEDHVVSTEENLRRTNPEHAISEEHTRNLHGPRLVEKEVPPPGRSVGDAMSGPKGEPGSGSTDGQEEIPQYVATGSEGFDKFMNETIHYVVKHPDIVGGASGGVVGTAGMGGIGALIYKKFIVVAALA